MTVMSASGRVLLVDDTKFSLQGNPQLKIFRPYSGRPYELVCYFSLQLGHNAATSRVNLELFMDNLVNGIATTPNACLFDLRGNKISGFYHGLKLP